MPRRNGVGTRPELRERERERERHPRRWDHTRRPRHLLDTAWACRVPRTRGTQHCTLLGAVPRRVVPPPRPRATLWSERIACDSNRHRHAAPRVRCELHRGRKKKGEGVRERERGNGSSVSVEERQIEEYWV